MQCHGTQFHWNLASNLGTICALASHFRKNWGSHFNNRKVCRITLVFQAQNQWMEILSVACIRRAFIFPRCLTWMHESSVGILGLVLGNSLGLIGSLRSYTGSERTALTLNRLWSLAFKRLGFVKIVTRSNRAERSRAKPTVRFGSVFAISICNKSGAGLLRVKVAWLRLMWLLSLAWFTDGYLSFY